VPTINARSIKCTLVLDAAELLNIAVPDAGPQRITLSIQTPDRTVTADLASESIRKAQAAIRENGADGVACVLQGKLAGPAGDQIIEAGLVAQPKGPSAAFKQLHQQVFGKPPLTHPSTKENTNV
jgi:hypothetical protein